MNQVQCKTDGLESFSLAPIHRLEEIFLLLLVIFSVHAGHKRIIIKVPQRTRHIYHHHVKKVPVYVVLPEHKPKVISDLETLVKTQPATTSAPCKEPVPNFDEYSPHYRQARYSYSEKDSYHPDWIEDRDNKGAFVPIEGPKELDREFQPPPVASDNPVYEFGYKTSRTKKSKKHASRKLVSDPKFSKSASYQQFYSKPVLDEQHYSKPDEQQFSKPVLDEQLYSKPISEQQHYSKPISDQQLYSKPIAEQQLYSKPISEQHYSKPISDQQSYSKPVSDQKHYSKSTSNYQRYSKLVPEKYESSVDSNSRFLPSSYGVSSEPEYSKELEELLALPPTASGDFENSYASSYQYRINHRMDEIPTT